MNDTQSLHYKEAFVRSITFCTKHTCTPRLAVDKLCLSSNDALDCQRLGAFLLISLDAS